MFHLSSLLQPLLLALPPESAHALASAGLRLMPCAQDVSDDPRLCSQLLGLTFFNPVGIAAGFDKNAKVADKFHGLGFGFAEIGGVTPRPQSGNARPRVFRLPEDKALINRLGFNNEGAAVVRTRLANLRGGRGVIGVNLGANKDSSDRIADYLQLVSQLGSLADFVTLNISSPNTPGLRDLQGREALHKLLSKVMEAREKTPSRNGERLPLLLKISPDLSLHDIDDIAWLSLEHGVNGLIISNTTVLRPDLRSAQAAEGGGLSGRPLFALSTRILAQMRQRVGKDMVLIGVGGIDSGEAAWAKICAGANLLQLYTGLVYKGLGLVDEIKRTLVSKLVQNNFASLQEAVACKAEFFAHKSR